MPRYAALIYGPAEDEGQDVPPEVMEQIMGEYDAFGEAAGEVVVGGEALYDTDTATTVTVEGGKGGKATFTDGPFAETKEVLGGFYLLDCDNLDEALQWAQQIPGAWHGKVEVRACIDFDTDSD